MRKLFLFMGIFFLLSGLALGEHKEKMYMDVAKKKVPAFNFTTVTAWGEAFNLNALKGKVVFLNFWATWCVPCRVEMPAMERLSNKMKWKPFAMVAVNLEEPVVLVRKFVQDHKLTFDVVLDPDGKIGADYNANNLPLTYIIDKTGHVIMRAVGPREWDSKASIHLFEELMGEKVGETTPAPQPRAAG